MVQALSSPTPGQKGNITDILSQPSKVELYESGLSGSAWLLFIGVIIIVGGGALAIATSNGDALSALGTLIGAWIIGGILGYAGYLAISNALKIERLRLAAHMLRSISLHATLAEQKGNKEALELIQKMAKREKGFITRTFRAAGANVEEAFVEGAIRGIKEKTEPPYILVYRNGVLDTPSTLAANLTARTAGTALGALAFIFLGIILLAVAVIIGSIIAYTTANTLRNHAKLENKIRRLLGLEEKPADAPGAGGLIASILTGGLYLPIYTRKLTDSITAHVTSH